MNKILDYILNTLAPIVVYVFFGLMTAVLIVGLPLLFIYQLSHVDKDTIYEDNETICTHSDDSEFTYCYNKLTNEENCKYHYYYRDDKPPVNSKCYSNS